METNPITRRLAAIVVADVVGFSRHMERDDAGTLAHLREIREQLIDPKINAYGGHVVKTAGDGMLIEFSSADAALRCAVDVQRAMAARNESLASDDRIEFRIGINLGDIIVDGNDIAGDGVNVAARLEALAEPGGICVSGSVREQVHGNVDVGFVDIGEQQVKNIARPIRVYRIMLGAAASGTLAESRVQRIKRAIRGKRWPWFAGPTAALCLIAVVVLVQRGWHGSAPSTPLSATASLPAAFSVAVQSFTAPGATLADQQFAELVTQGITIALGRTMHYATIVSHPLVATEVGKAIDTRAIGRDHSVRYLLEGDVHTSGDKVSVTAKLVDAESATQLWSEQFDAARLKWVTDSGDASWPLINGLRRALWSAEEQRVAHSSGGSASPWDLVLRARILERNRSLNGTLEARKLYDEALRLDPAFTTALNRRAWINVELWEDDPNGDRVQLAQEMDQFARRAVAIDRTDSLAWLMRAGALTLQWRWDAALEADAEAVRLQPWSTSAAGWRPWILDLTGRADEALVLLDKAVALEPSLGLSPNFRHNQCYAHLLLGQFDRAIATCEQSVAVGDDWWPYMFLTAAYAQTGDLAKADASKAELLRWRPGFSIARFRTLGLSDNPVYTKQNETNFVPGLRKAGIPEQ